MRRHPAWARLADTVLAAAWRKPQGHKHQISSHHNAASGVRASLQAEGTVVVNRWWDGDADEVYWMEITGRPDRGANLAAPQADETGHEYAGYTLVCEVRHGDVVFHFDRNQRQILGWSRAVGAPYPGTIRRAARGTSARQHGVDAYDRPGWFINLEGPYALDQPVTLTCLRDHEQLVRAVRAESGSQRESHDGRA
jgi:hypothetical protein